MVDALVFPAALLLFCITDALGNWLRADNVMIDGKSQKIGKCTFRVFNHECFGLQLTGKQISFLERDYRNRLAHNALIEAGAVLAPTDAIPVFDFKSEIEARISIFSFHALVLKACERFPRERIKDWERQHWINFVKRLRRDRARTV
jgi:hypothetical protein